MNIGKLRDRLELMERTKEKDSIGKTEYKFNPLKKFRGNFRMMDGEKVLLNAIEGNKRKGTILTHYRPWANENGYIRVNGGMIYSVITFTHDDKKSSTIFTIEEFTQ